MWNVDNVQLNFNGEFLGNLFPENQESPANLEWMEWGMVTRDTAHTQ